MSKKNKSGNKKEHLEDALNLITAIINLVVTILLSIRELTR